MNSNPLLRQAFFALLSSATTFAQTTERVSVDSAGAQGNGNSLLPSASGDGRYVAFLSHANNLVMGDTNGLSDVFVRDRLSATTVRVSVSSAGAQPGNMDDPTISSDGRFVAFIGYGPGLVAGDTNNAWDIFVHDSQSATTVRVSVDSSGTQANANNIRPSISADGRFVTWISAATNLVPGDTNNANDVFVHDRATGTTERASVDSAGNQGNGNNERPALSADGRYVVFIGYGSNLVAGDTNNFGDVFVRDRIGGTTERASVDSAGNEAHGNCDKPSISADGRFVAFTSYADDLVVGDTNQFGDTFVRDRTAGTTERVSVGSGGAQAHGNSIDPSISADGRFVAFISYANDLVAGDTNNAGDVFVHDRAAATTTVASVDANGVLGNANSEKPSISGDGRFVAFIGYASNLVPGDTNGSGDAFVRDLGSSSFTSFCFGDGSGGACPCGNTGLPGHGCDNSAATGGALLSASGTTTPDSVVLTSSGELPTALSIFLQGNAQTPVPLAFGDGLRCVGGSLKRIGVKTAVGGTAVYPEPGDPSISARSAALGDPIAPGSIRWYQVYYRDPTLAFCPAPPGNSWNIGHGIAVTWQ